MSNIERDRADRRDSFTKHAAVSLLACVIAFCLSLSLIAGAMAARLAAHMGPRFSGQITVVIWGEGLESADAAAARAGEVLAAQSGIRRAVALDADESDAVIGEAIAGQSLGVEPPRLVSVSGAPTSVPSAASLRRLLIANHFTISLDDHRGTQGSLEVRALVVGGLGVALAVILCGGLFAACMTSGLSTVSSATSRLDLMARLGADQALIASMVGRRQGLIALASGVLGAVCADLILFAVVLSHGLWSNFVGPDFTRPEFLDGVWTLASPLFVAVIAGTAGGLGGWLAIRRRERAI